MNKLDISELDLTEEDGYAVIEAPISIINSEFRQSVHFGSVLFKGQINFSGTAFREGTWFDGALFNKYPEFMGAKFYDDGFFQEAQFMSGAGFSGAHFCECAAVFEDALFDGVANFINARFEGEAFFEGNEFNDVAEFSGAVFGSNAFFDNAKFNKFAEFRAFIGRKGTTFLGEISSFRGAKFEELKAQEDACRKAKNVLEKNGDREEAGYHFYREMEAKRKQKPWYYRYPEFIFIQMIFGYGVHPWRLIGWWFITIATFAAIYRVGNGLNGAAQLFDYLKFSLATATAPGYIATIISPGSTGYELLPEYQAVAVVESIFGTFLWAGFIATFARKYMR
jgi:uncharacterized protein YjbI with pentapeptide repeats